jgi:hypothetical protein
MEYCIILRSIGPSDGILSINLNDDSLLLQFPTTIAGRAAAMGKRGAEGRIAGGTAAMGRRGAEGRDPAF